jgi:hypothetical protein
LAHQAPKQEENESYAFQKRTVKGLWGNIEILQLKEEAGPVLLFYTIVCL